MINAFYAAKSGTKNYQYYLDAVSNNISNINTESYKAQSVNFTDLMYTDIAGDDGTLQNGNGSKVMVSRDMSQGAAQSSDNASDIMINGGGFFAVQEADGDIAYTRSGSLSASEIDGVNYLVTENGDFVLDENLNKITIDPQTALSIKAPGEDNTAATDNTITLGIFSFSNTDNLVATGNGKYVIDPTSTLTATPDTESTIVTNMIESSNVDLITEMAKMINAQRGFQMNAKMIQTADEMEQYANNLSV
jgi:flagellar basal-body rod protein FlgG